MDYRQLLMSQANALAAAGCYGVSPSSAAAASTGAQQGALTSYPVAAAAAAAAAAAYNQNAARTYSYRLWTLANVLTDPCRLLDSFCSFISC
jgi:hypothetical protein